MPRLDSVMWLFYENIHFSPILRVESKGISGNIETYMSVYNGQTRSILREWSNFVSPGVPGFDIATNAIQRELPRV